jgi:hypothetical protein
MHGTTARRLLLAGRLLSAGLALAALGTAAVWRWRPQWVDAVDQALVRRHLEADRQRIEAAAALAGRDPAAAIEELRGLCARFSGGLRSEHRGQRWAEASAILARLLRAGGQRDQALELCRERVRFHPLDLIAHLDLIDLLAQDLRDSNEHDQRLHELHALLPENQAVTQRMLAYLAGKRQHAAWGKALAAHLRSARRYAFRILVDWPGIPSTWILSEPFQPQCAAGILRSELLLAAGAAGVRVQPPAGVTLHDPRLEVAGLGAIAGEASADGPVFALPAPLPAPAAARFGAGVDVAEPPWLQAILLGPDAEAALSELPPGPECDQVRRHRAAAAFAEGLALLWRAAPEPFAEERRSQARARLGFPAEDGIPFRVEFPIDAACAELRLLLPGRTGLAFTIASLEAVGAAPAPLATGPEQVGLDDLRFEAGALVSTGPRPVATVRLPGPAHVRRVLLTGVLR